MIKTNELFNAQKNIHESAYNGNITTPTAFDLYQEPNLAPDYSFAESFKAGFRQYSPIPSLVRMMENTDFVDDPNYDPMADEQIPKGYEWRFLNSSSAEESSVRLERLESDLKDLEVIEYGSMFGTALGGLMSPLIVAPVGTFKTLANTNFLKRFVGSAALTTALYAPEELLIQSQSEARNTKGDLLIPLVTAGMIGGTVGGLFGRRIAKNQYPNAPEFAQKNEEGIFKSAGASADPSNPRVLKDIMDKESLETTGIGIEKMPWNPVTRLTNSSSLLSRQVVAGLVDMGGVIQKKVKGGSVSGSSMDQSVETTFRTKYLSKLLDGIRASDTAYLEFRGIVAKEGDIGRSMQMMGVRGSDHLKKNNTLDAFGFRERISKAMRNGDVDVINDSATPFVNKAAHSYRQTLNHIKEQATEVKLFELDMQKTIAGLKIKVANGTADASALIEAEARLKNLRESGVHINTAKSYLPKIARVDKIMANESKFINRVSNWSQKYYGYTKSQGDKFATEVMMDYTHARPFYDLDEGSGLVDWITQAGSSKARKHEIPDELIEDFLENDIEVLVRHHTKTMGMDIELTRKYGDISMSKVIKSITEDYNLKINKAPTTAERQKLIQGLANDLKDVRGLRDRLRGTYGASKDPHNMTSRFIRQMKSFNVLVGMGGAAVSSIPDIARPIMTEGFKNVYDHGMRHMFKSVKSNLKSMQRDEIRRAGIAVDAALGLRAHAFADVGDLFGSRHAMERALNQSTGIFFLMNGLNYWNQTIKEFTGGTIALRMTSGLMQDWAKLSKTERRKFLSNGIEASDHARMQIMIKENGEKIDGEWLPNTAYWKDVDMVLKFRNALNQSVERTIVTPGAGDRALWTSTEFGSMITQFKGYGQGSFTRLLTSGLQEKDSAFWQGAFVLVGLAAMVNEMKKIQYGIDKEQSYPELLVDAVDRSGILGWFTDVNNSLEKLSDYRLGLRSMIGAKQTHLPFGSKVQAVGGATIGNLATFGDVATDFITGEADDTTLRSARFITPTGNLPYLDPIWDEIMAAK